MALSQPAAAGAPQRQGETELVRPTVGPAQIADRMLAALVEVNGVPGMAAAVWKDGAILWAGEAGFRNAEQRLPVEAGTVFRLASVSKIFAVVAAARLREQGLLDVNRPVQEIVDHLDNDWPPITSRQLASHTSGIPHYQEIDSGRGGIKFENMEKSVSVFSGRDLLFTPGTGYNYSSYGYTLLSAVVEKAAGQPYLDYLAAAIVPGLHIGPDITDTSHTDASTAYTYIEGELAVAPPHDYSYSWGGAGLGSNASDLAEFGGRILSGAVISDASFAWMQQPARLSDGSSVEEGGFPVGFGLRGGTDIDGERIVHHAGVTLGARSVLMLYPDSKVAASVLSNAPWVSNIEQTAIMLAAPFHKPLAPQDSNPCPLEATRYAGTSNGVSLVGTAHFVLDEGICVGTISIAGPLAEWFNNAPQRDTDSIRIIGLNAHRGLASAALITPYGAYDFRPDGGAYSTEFNSKRSLSVTFE
ncbi:serine hydrolase domain-containing protein [Allopontixanthobacter sp.]|uniref:serine hydrolase domain-containing protein n=1 Tax=Allopontixanthobacter sp. TaxID=2906452 RepID=UPI002AB90CCD|nr:serine hydrolase domain-containing protein [Allopontixanthobacter sp.]MDZ4307628.1 serine hydrolase domain-containing protein [Allopontixanthobacter sp.]